MTRKFYLGARGKRPKQIRLVNDQLPAPMDLPAEDHRLDRAGIADVLQRIGVQQHQIRHLAALDRSAGPQLAAIPRCVPRRGLQRLQRREARIDERDKLVVQAEAEE